MSGLQSHLRLQLLVETLQLPFLQGHAEGLGDVVCSFWFAGYVTQAGERPVIIINISKPPVGYITSVAPSCSITPQTQAVGLPRPSVGLPGAGLYEFQGSSILNTHLFSHRCWAIPPCQGPRRNRSRQQGAPCRPLCWFALYLYSRIIINGTDHFY